MAKAKTKTVDLGKAGKFTSHPGRLHRELGIPQGEKIGVTRERAALKSKNPQTRRDARSALGYAGMAKGKNHNGPHAHVGRNGLHYGAHVGHKAVGAPKMRDCR